MTKKLMAGLYQFIMNVNYRIRHNDRQQMKSSWHLLGQTYGSISCELPFWKKKTIISCHIPADSLLLCHYWTDIADCGKKGRGCYQDILWGSEKSGNYQIKTFNENIQPANSSKHCAITNRWINNIMIIIISRLPLAWISSIDFLIESMSILLIIYRLTLFVNTIWTAHHLSRITWWVKTVHYLGRLNHAWGWFTKVLQFISTHLQSFLFVTTNWDHVVVVYLTIK